MISVEAKRNELSIVICNVSIFYSLFLEYDIKT